MAAVTRAEATAQVRRTIAAYRDRVHEVRNDTDRLPPAGARIVDEYCLDRNDEQTLVLKAIGTSAFLDGMDDALLLEYCAVCMELDDALGLGSWRIGKVDRIAKDDKSIWETLWGALQGEFNEEQTGREILMDMGLNFIPGVGQLCDIRDIAACLKKLILERRVNEAAIWVTLLLTAVGCIPYAGDVVKAGCKAILKGADDIVLTILKKLNAEDVYKAFWLFRSKFVSNIDRAIVMVCAWIEEARKSKYGNKANAILASAGDSLRKAADFVKKQIDDFMERVFRIKSVAALDGLADIVPSKCCPRAQAALARMPKEQRQEVVEYINKLFKDYKDRKKTMQIHHWIEQSRIKDTKKYPFLSCPPMKEDLLKSEKNLSLIVGHNGGHKNAYNRLLDKKLDFIKEELNDLCKKRNISYEAFMKDNNTKKMINKEIERTITELRTAVKNDHTILNNTEKMFILD